MIKPIDKFQALLRELFQFDCADLDFGIYRIMNHKREVIEKFITSDLPKAVADELDRGALAEQTQAARELESAKKKVLESLGEDALDDDGDLAEQFRTTKAGKAYISARAKATGSRGREVLEAGIFNHLYAFFSRYYQEGDFISKRRYSKRERYAIPYNGEEVYLHWANSDQYYVKTAEYFTDYAFTSGGVTIHFKLQTADVEQNNVKGEKRFFLPRAKEIGWNEKAKELLIPFEYRPLTGQEAISFGKKNQQEAIITRALDEIPRRLSPKNTASALAALIAEKRKTADDQPVTFLEHHLRQYTRRNTSDFFIHKDLKGFLSRELDFYLKNEVLNLDEMEIAGEERTEGWFQTMRVIKAVGGRIIDFLDQIENFQKMLWEKRKFITETQYCITVGNIDESFYGDIAACEPQWAEWKELFHIDEEEVNLFTSGKSKKEKRTSFLKSHPTLVLDTKHFDADFADRLLGSIDELDEQIDGLLFHSENFQALNVLFERFGSMTRCIYIDPPYNTAASEILYMNNYKHSSWLSLMVNRLSLARLLLATDGIICVAVDDAEYHRLYHCLETIFSEDVVLGTAIVRSNPAGRSAQTGFSVSHDYALFAGATENCKLGQVSKSADQISRYDQSDELGKYEWVNFRKHGGLNANRSARPKLFYPIYATEHGKVRIPRLEWDDHKNAWRTTDHPSEQEKTIFPVNERKEEKTWKWGHETAMRDLNQLTARLDRTGLLGIYMRSRMREGSLPSTLWVDRKYSATDYGTNLLTHIIGASNSFPFPKSIHTVEECLRVGSLRDSDYCLDYFGGSGTTGHAVINLNREDGEIRKFILVEMGQYFDTVLLPRIKKVIYVPEWKDGKPKRMATREEAERSPRIVKYMRLESYEDALNNIGFDDTSSQRTMEFEDYLLRYFLRWETRGSDTLLNLEKLSSPFSYKLQIHEDGRTHEKLADIPETFNYLLGLHVQTRKVCHDKDRRYLVYRGQIDHRQIVVIWREAKGWKKADLEQDRKFVAAQKLTEGADEVFVNGDSFIPNAKALEPIFKARMFAPVEA